MSDNKLALALALEAEHEATEVADTYEGISKALDIDSNLDDAGHATDVAAALENLHFIMENFPEMDVTSMALVQVIGDIAGAGSGGMDGRHFTAAMEAYDGSTNSLTTVENAGGKAEQIIAKIEEIIAYVIAKIKEFIAWVIQKFQNGYKHLKEAAVNLKHIVGRSMDNRSISKMRKRLGLMIELARAIEAFIPICADLSAVRIESADAEFGHNEETIDVSMIRRMENMMGQLETYEKKFPDSYWKGAIKIIPHTERISHNNVLSTSASFAKNYFEVSKGIIASSGDADDETMSKIGHDMVSEIEDVVEAYGRFMSKHGNLSLVTLAENIGEALKKIDATVKRAGLHSMGWRHGERAGGTKVAAFREILAGTNKDISAITKISGFVDSECSSLTKMLNHLKNVDEPVAA